MRRGWLDNVLHMVYRSDVPLDRFVAPNQRCRPYPCVMPHVRFTPQTDRRTASLALVSSCGTHRYGKTADEWLDEKIVSYETLSRSSRHAHLLLQGLRLARRVLRFHTSLFTVLCLKNASVFYLFIINPIFYFEISCLNILLQYVLLI